MWTEVCEDMACPDMRSFLRWDVADSASDQIHTAQPQIIDTAQIYPGSTDPTETPKAEMDIWGCYNICHPNQGKNCSTGPHVCELDTQSFPEDMSDMVGVHHMRFFTKSTYD